MKVFNLTLQPLLKKSFIWCFCTDKICESSSAGRARPCQGRGRGFESRLSLKYRENNDFLYGIFFEKFYFI